MSVSIVLPIYNEASNLPLVYKELVRVLAARPDLDYEFILVNDGSVDNSWAIIQQLVRQDERIVGIKFSRNFGHQIALKAGYDAARGDAVITMDADMQHPPRILIEMLERWRNGADIVYVRPINRKKDGFLKKLTARSYYKILDAITEVAIPRDVGDFRLLDKKVVHILKQDKQKSPFWRGMVAWTGFNHSFIECDYANRHAGKTGYTWLKMIKLASDGITGFSLFPLKIAAFVGVFVIISGSAMFAYITVDALLHDVYYPLFKWLVTIIYIFMGVQFLLLWLMGEYIGRMYEQQKERPTYIIADTCTQKKKEDYESRNNDMPLRMADMDDSRLRKNG